MSDAKDFPFPLDKDIEEQIPVKKLAVEVDERGKATVKMRTVLEKQTVRYMNVPKIKTRCSDGSHVFRSFKPRKWMFACTKCPYVRRVSPISYRFNQATGQLVNRQTGQIV